MVNVSLVKLLTNIYYKNSLILYEKSYYSFKKNLIIHLHIFSMQGFNYVQYIYIYICLK